MMKIACQAIVFGNEHIKSDIERVMRCMAEIGYDGAEIGARHFDLDRPEYYMELLHQHGLALPAIHVGGDFLNRDSVAQQLESIGRTVRFAARLGCEYMYVSGAYAPDKSDEDYIHEASTYAEIGRRCVDAGLVLCYHNHDWEFENDARGMALLMEHVPEELMKLVPDVGWIAVAGGDPAAFITEHAERVKALHFKDFAHDQKPRAFTELGSGIVEFGAVMEWVKSRGEIWVTAEQDETARKPEESAALNYAFIKGRGEQNV